MPANLGEEARPTLTSRPARRIRDSSGRWREWHTPVMLELCPFHWKEDGGGSKMLKSHPYFGELPNVVAIIRILAEACWSRH